MTMSCRWTLLACLFLLALAAPSSHAFWSYPKTETKDPPGLLVSPIVNREIKVSVTAKWPSSPSNVLCEAWAFCKDNWDFLDQLVSIQNQNEKQAPTYQSMTQLALQAAKVAGIPNVPLLQYALSMRAASPTCEMHRGLAQDALSMSSSSVIYETSSTLDAFCVLVPTGAVVTDPNDCQPLSISIAGEEESSGTILDDWLLPGEVPRGGGTASAGLVILYANLGSASFRLFYQRLIELEVPFVVRYHLNLGKDAESTATSTAHTILQGYGVRLDIKNVEYKVFEDLAVNAEERKASMLNVSALDMVVPQFLAGVNLTALGMTEEDIILLQQQETLWKTHQAQELLSQIIPPTWQRRQLSLQAATVIVAAMDPLQTLQEVSQNLPSVASTLVHVPIEESSESESSVSISSVLTEPMESTLQIMIRTSGGGLWINGKPVAIERPSFNVFELIQLLQKEQAQLTALETKLSPWLADASITSPAAALVDIQQAWSMGQDFFEEKDDESSAGGAGEESFRINVASGWKHAIMYLNDIEKDPKYRQWSTSPRDMVMAMQYGMPPTLRRNVYTILAVTDPSVPVDHPAIVLATQTMKSSYPTRFGVLIVGEKDIDECASWVADTQPKDDVACPMNSALFGGEDKIKVPTADELKGIVATARMVHNLVAYMAQEYSSQKDLMLIAYQSNLDQTIHMTMQDAKGPMLSAFDLMNMHVQILAGMRIGSPSIDDTIEALVDLEEDEYVYGKAVRFAVDKGLKPGMGFLNGIPLPTASASEESAMEEMSGIFQKEAHKIFQMVVQNEFTETEPKSLYDFFLSGSKVFPRVHPLFTAGDGATSHIELSHSFGPESLLFPKETSSPADAAAVFVVDAVLELDTSEGIAIADKLATLMGALSATIADKSVAVAYRIIPSTRSAAGSSRCAIVAQAKQLGAAIAIEKLINSKGEESKLDASEDGPCSQLNYLDEDLPSRNFLVANGRVLTIQGTALEYFDLDLLLSIDLRRTEAVTDLLKKHVAPDSSLYYDVVARTSTFLGTANSKSSTRSNPEADVFAMEADLGIEKNPLRFSWNQIGGGTDNLLKVCDGVDTGLLANPTLLNSLMFSSNFSAERNSDSRPSNGNCAENVATSPGNSR
jgi:hypothetical protein